jgi:hypothetical protein
MQPTNAFGGEWIDASLSRSPDFPPLSLHRGPNVATPAADALHSLLGKATPGNGERK